MKTKIFKSVLLLLLCGAFLHANQKNSTNQENILKYGSEKISIGTLSVSVAEVVKLKPNITKFSITYLTEGVTPNDASNKNVENMRKLKTFLSSLNIKDKDITTLSYNNYQNLVSRKVIDNKALFETKLGVNFIIPKENFYTVINMLEKNGVNNVIKNKNYQYYTFMISKINDNETKTKKETEEAFKEIEKSLKKLGAHEIEVAEYETKKITQENEDIQKYFVSNTIQVKTNNFNNIGKIISKAQELKMTINNDISYSISDEEKEKILSSVESMLLDKLIHKATTLLDKKYSLGVPKTLSYNKNDFVVQPRYYNYENKMVSNLGQAQAFDAQEVNINTPSEFEITLTMSGVFEVVQSIFK